MIQISESAPRMTVAVDGGASNSRFGLYNESGILLGAIKDGPASLSLPDQQAEKTILAGLRRLASELQLAPDWAPDELLLGLAGAMQEDRKRLFLQKMPADTAITLVPDGQAQLLGATGGSSGICLAVGTGSVVHWQTRDGEMGMAGGWGYPVGDEGGGSWLGRHCLKHYCWWLDQGSPAPAKPLVEKLQSRIGAAVADLEGWTICKEPARIASLAEVVVAAAKAGDTTASEIIELGLKHCCRLIENAPPDLPIYVVGGLAEVYHPGLKREFGDRLRTPVSNAVDGLLHLSTVVKTRVVV